jgi:hypothetical protein
MTTPVRAVRTERGHIRNLLPSAIESVGPFIFLDHIGPNSVPAGAGIQVPPHPHAGIETISYLYAGSSYHRDSLGYEQLLEPGRLNWMTSGSGIIHSEGTSDAFARTGGTMHGLQLWTYLSEADQQLPPAFQTFAPGELPTRTDKDASLTLLGGTWLGMQSPVQLRRDLLLGSIVLPAGGRFEASLPAGFEGGAYVVSGNAWVNEQLLGDATLLPIAPGSALQLTSDEGATVMVLAGPPLTEKRVAYGSFVMHSPAAIRAALDRYAAGDMGTL